MSHMTFSGEAGCPQFLPNPFKADICKSCSNKIQSHNGATEEQIKAAIEFSADKFPSDIAFPANLEGRGRLFLGGYKAAVNVEFLQKGNVKLIVNTAKGLEQVFGPKYVKQVKKRKDEITDLEVVQLDWYDCVNQEITLSELSETADRIDEHLEAGNSVLVHCAQGRSRSASVVVFYFCRRFNLGLKEGLAHVRRHRLLAQPNDGFMKQLEQHLQKSSSRNDKKKSLK